MAKVTLRVYIREIESMIEAGQLEEAVAHCQHILKIFPMHVDTYRLLGKSLLEAKRYEDAADIFQRVLMAVPDDFVAHVGMSIIRDDEGKLDDAIWHMERAFEGQPSNPAIQGELRRLYGRRDGVEPSKIRLNRDALANMYAQGELFNQAIAEIRAVLAEDPNRPDLQVMLARSYYRSGQKVEAAEMAANLLKKYAYCLDALRILVDVLPGSARAENTQVYRQRLSMLEPYSSFATDSMFNTNQVADAVVDLERLEYAANVSPTLQRPHWVSSLGIKLTGEEHINPIKDSMRTVGSEESLPQNVQDSNRSRVVPTADEMSIPDWMRSSEWEGTNSKGTEEPIGVNPEQPAKEIAQSDIPDWLNAMAPKEIIETNSGSTPATANLTSSNNGEMPSWLQGISPQEVNDSVIKNSVNPSLPGEEQIPEKMVQPGLSTTIDIQESSGSEVSAMDHDAFPDWIKELGDEGVVGTGSIETNDILDQPRADEFTGPTQPGPNLPANQIPIEPLVSEFQENPEKILKTADESKPLIEEGETNGRLEEIKTKQDGTEEELLTKPSDNLDGIPDWLQSSIIEQVSSSGSKVPVETVEPITSVASSNDQPMDIEPEIAAVDEFTPDEALPNKSTRPLVFEAVTKILEEESGDIQIEKEVLQPLFEDHLIGMPDRLRSAEELPASSPLSDESISLTDDGHFEPPPPIAKEPDSLDSSFIGNLPIDHDEHIVDKPDWLRSFEEQPFSDTSAEPTPVEKESILSESATALAGDSAVEFPISSGETTATNIDRMDDKPDWLRSIEALPTTPETLKPSAIMGETIAMEPVSQLSKGIEDIDSTPMDELSSQTQLVDGSDHPKNIEDETLAWLEGLATRQDALEEERLTKPEEKVDNKPEGLRSIGVQPVSPTTSESSPEISESLPLGETSQSAGEMAPIQPTPVEEFSLPTIPTDGIENSDIEKESMDWLAGSESHEESKPEESPEIKLGSTEIPEVLSQGENDHISIIKEPTQKTPEDDITITSWLSKKDVEEAVRKSRSKSEVAQPPVSEKKDLPDWLKNLEEPLLPEEKEKSVETLPDWLRQPAQPADQISRSIPAPESGSEPELPAWIDEEIPATVDSKPTTPSEWVPIAEKPVVQAEIGSISELDSIPVENQLMQRFPKPTGILAAIPAKDKDAELLTEAQRLLEDNKLVEAMQAYTLLIKKNRLLDEVIHDLREAIYRFPVDIIVWQTLGDASIRANRLQDALDAYTKAEELLR
jgi:tetratricopeptide (TPR) repeat protein